MWLPTFLQRGIHFSASEPRSWLSIILYSSIVSICLSSESARPWSRRKQPYFRNQPSRFAAWRFLLCSLTTNRPFALIRHDRTCSSVDFGRIAVAPSDLEYNQGRDHRIAPFFEQGFQSGNAMAFFNHSVAVAVISSGLHNHFNRDEKLPRNRRPVR